MTRRVRGGQDMIEVFQAEVQHAEHVHALLREYLAWAIAGCARELGVHFDLPDILAATLNDLDAYQPPTGRLLLARVAGEVAGCAFLHQVAPGAGEIKRMYVRPAFRRQGIGRALGEACIAAGRAIGWARLRLDSARFMTAAHALYQSLGFREIAPYAESEIPPEHRAHWLFMERAL